MLPSSFSSDAPPSSCKLPKCSLLLVRRQRGGERGRDALCCSPLSHLARRGAAAACVQPPACHLHCLPSVPNPPPSMMVTYKTGRDWAAGRRDAQDACRCMTQNCLLIQQYVQNCKASKCLLFQQHTCAGGLTEARMGLPSRIPHMQLSYEGGMKLGGCSACT